MFLKLWKPQNITAMALLCTYIIRTYFCKMFQSYSSNNAYRCLLPSGMWHSLVWQNLVYQCFRKTCCLHHLGGWWQRQQFPLQQNTSGRLNDVTYQKTLVL